MEASRRFAGLLRFGWQLSLKHFLADPALVARLLHITAGQLISGATHALLNSRSGTTLGRLFESLVALSLQTYAQVNRAELRHFRSVKGDHEVDFIVERGFALIAIEAKISADITSDDVRHLNWLAASYTDYQIARVILAAGKYAYTRPGGVHVIPASLLCA